MTVEISKLTNGVTLATENMPHLETASLGIWVAAGSRFEDEKEHGIAHMLEHMAFKGTSNRTAREITEQIENVGGELNAFTSIEYTAYSARVLAEDVSLAVDILCDILTNSVFETSELIKERRVILQEIGATHDSPEDYVFDSFQQTAFSGQAIGRPILGTPELVASFNRSDLCEFMEKRYRAPAIVFSCTGKVSHESILDMITERLSDIDCNNGTSPSPATYTGGKWHETRELREIQVMLGFKGYSYLSGRHYAAHILAILLGGGMSSRLFQQVREAKGLCYSISACHWPYRDIGLFGVHTATEINHIDELMEAIAVELSRICDDLPEEELNKAKAQLKAALFMSAESPVSKAHQTARQIITYGRQLPASEIIQRIDEVRTSDLKDMAGDMFRTSNPTIASLGPDKLPDFLRIFRETIS